MKQNLSSSFFDFFTEDDKEKICKYLSFEKNFFDENILPKRRRELLLNFK